ncbi:DEAD/DEAH box helicase [Corynebacterium sp. UBA2622]|uniref:DEAD/DEAH box helicase n=1 Tax=Corynebacterium sp. UBA2622 TaxID=1946393 RepID=UPI0025C42124|nr:DEAD/DEAH box helicase [Corynebacterium sp. UBA2622]
MPDKSLLRQDVEHGFIEADHRVSHFDNPQLVSNRDGTTMLGALRSELESADSFIFSVAFVTADALGMIKQQLNSFTGAGTIVTSDYLDFNDPDSLRELLTFKNVSVRIMSGQPHHAKGYIFHHGDHVTALIGSSNLTRKALSENNEWNLQFSSHRDGDIADQLNRAVRWQVQNSVPLTEEWIARYELGREKRVIVFEDDQPLAVSPGGDRILPNLMQVEALENLQKVQESGEKRALIISATGTGKTILAALAARQMHPQRVLFLAHREQILNKAAEEFMRVMQCTSSDIGVLAGARHDLDRRFVFATIQSLSRPDNLAEISPLQFDLVIVDEVHRSGAESYRKVLNYFRPAFTLGLTATPERSDGFNVFELFDYNVPYEIRLEGALENRMLVPFDYYGVSDYQSPYGFTITDDSDLTARTSEQRVDHLVSVLEDYSFARGTKGLIFCSSNDEAQRLSDKLNGRRVHGRPLRTVALSGSNSIESRERAVSQLEDGALDYLLTVDIFNEGIDIPALNVVVMLRGTQSSIVFTQQLGRGLRKHSDKHSLRVIDLIGNYANNYLIPIALTGDRSGSKDHIREGIRRTRRHTVAGSSTISFDRVSMQRIVESLQKARITSRLAKREAILALQFRLGKVPRLIDFENHGSMNPFLLASSDSKARNYWTLLNELKFVASGPSAHEAAILDMLSLELLNGKRPQELLLIRELLKKESVNVEDFRSLLSERNLDHSEALLDSVVRVLDLSWFVTTARTRYGDSPLIVRRGDVLRLGERFSELYFSYNGDHPSPAISFRAHVDDIIETGLLLNRKHYGSSDHLLPGKTYSRKDASRLLNWKMNSEATIMGYKVDKDTATCPIFVTYHKDSEVNASQRYEDSLIDQSTMQWFSRHGRTLQSAELQPILHGDVSIHLFVKREDADGLEFHYLGQAEATRADQSTMRGNRGETLDVVIANLKLRQEVPRDLFEAITASLAVEAPH